MCPPIIAAVVSLVATIGGSMLTASSQSSQAQEEARIQQQQLKIEMENERIKAMGDTNDRLDQFRRDEATNRAALSVSGVDNWSYAQGIFPANARIAGTDIARTAFNAGQQIGRKKYEISVAGWTAKATKRAAWTQAAVNSIGAVGEFGASVMGGKSASAGGGSIRAAS